jgi:Holliday junction resolvase-like predicted endonuclease
VIELDWRLLAALIAVALWLFYRITRAWGAWRRSLRARRRGARAVQGESDAELLLEDAGYEILERQLRKLWTLECDGEPVEFDLRADLLVCKEGQQFIAEVKTGERAPDLANAATRRQLLEYALAYNSPTILLVDVENEAIHEVIFPLHGEELQAVSAPMLLEGANS